MYLSTLLTDWVPGFEADVAEAFGMAAASAATANGGTASAPKSHTIPVHITLWKLSFMIYLIG